MVEVKNRGNDPVDSLLRKFTRRFQHSGIGKRHKNSRYHKKKETKSERRKRALYRVKVVKQKEKLAKMGRLEDEKSRFIAGKIGKNK
jgi:ribosomal protein S21